MSCRTTRSPPPSITARPSPDEKARFATIAAARGLSESALALSAIRTVIATDSGCLDPYATAPRVPATGRITVRLRPGDAEAITRRASQRDMRASTYVAALVRAHVAANPPLAVKELAALKASVVELAGLGRVLARVTTMGAPTGVVREELQRLRAAVADLEQRTHDLARAALISWEGGSE
ncbi:MAG: hypothetical protein ACRETP_01110 [Steroidobacteraceae bacterium]